MSKKEDGPTARAMRDACDFWFSQHPVSLGELFKEAIEKAAEAACDRWFEEHEEEILSVIRVSVKVEVSEAAAAVSGADVLMREPQP